MATLLLRDEKIEAGRFTGERIADAVFINCDFSSTDLTDTQFTDTRFYHRDTELGCNFSRAILKDASFTRCDLSMSNFSYANLLGVEIRESMLQGADFRHASFMNLIAPKVWFCSAYISKSNLSYANFANVVLEKCELWENRWHGTQVLGAKFSGSDLSGGEFSEFDWRTLDITHCDLTNSVLGELDVRYVDLQGVKLDRLQAAELMERLGILVVG